ncbi:hypothetical protein [Paenibacillus thalictri]|uniref:hypothetical protein n=1 Tax=Paenibacillus thalictri TaxID=2527873 RepID=UPI0013EF4F21|nr:hypothetical protein [Paenibacillus thalictri]
MDPYLIVLLALIVVSVLFRIRRTYRKTAKSDKSAQIQRQLQELRKKRDEDR